MLPLALFAAVSFGASLEGDGWTVRVGDDGLALQRGVDVVSTALRDVSDDDGALRLGAARRRERCAPGVRPCRTTIEVRRGPVEETWALVPEGVLYEVEVARGAWGPLLLRYEVDGGRASLGRHDVQFRLGDQRVSWTGLHATDASGRALPVRFASDAGGVAVLVDARGAAWPVRVARTVRPGN